MMMTRTQPQELQQQLVRLLYVQHSYRHNSAMKPICYICNTVTYNDDDKDTTTITTTRAAITNLSMNQLYI